MGKGERGKDMRQTLFGLIVGDGEDGENGEYLHNYTTTASFLGHGVGGKRKQDDPQVFREARAPCFWSYLFFEPMAGRCVTVAMGQTAIAGGHGPAKSGTRAKRELPRRFDQLI